MRELMQAFDDVKKQFAFSTRDVRFSLRGELENLDIFGKVNKGLITIPQYVYLTLMLPPLTVICRATMRGFFDSCITEIMTLIWEHVDRIEERGSRPKVSRCQLCQLRISNTDSSCSIYFLSVVLERLNICNIASMKPSERKTCR